MLFSWLREKSEASHFPTLVIDEPLITPLPVNEGETFNRAEYQIPPRLIEMSEQSNKIVIQANSSRSNVYLRIKELADELRSRREKKSKKKDSSCVVNREEKWSNGVDGAGETSGASQLSEKQRRTELHIRKLEKHLIKLHKAIKKLREEEVDFSCDDACSAYIQEDRFKRKAVAVWQKICQLEQRRATTGCERERKFRYEGTRFTEINAMVEKVINKRRNNRRVFPDFKDILDVVRSGNETHGLGLSTKEEKSLAEEVFQEVGRELQRRRQKDELEDALAYLEDGPGSDSIDDPAEEDKELLEKLKNNATLSQSKLNEVIEVYVAKQEELKLEPKEVEQDNCDLSSHPSESGESEDEDEDDEDLRNPTASLHDVSPTESAVEQEKTKLDSESICDLSASNNSSESEDSENEGKDCKEEEHVKGFLGNDRHSSKR
ncbi:hypothetical protein MTO96_006718 [Rhipicephalus appendiculatus]